MASLIDYRDLKIINPTVGVGAIALNDNFTAIADSIEDFILVESADERKGLDSLRIGTYVIQEDDNYLYQLVDVDTWIDLGFTTVNLKKICLSNASGSPNIVFNGPGVWYWYNTFLYISHPENVTAINLQNKQMGGFFDVTNMTSLVDLNMGNNSFTDVDVSGCNNLIILDVGNNLTLTSLNVTGCVNITLLYTDYLTMNDIVGINDLTLLNYFRISNVSDLSADFGFCPNLDRLEINSCTITSLTNISQQLLVLNLYETDISQQQFDNMSFPEVYTLQLAGTTTIETVDFANFPKLTYLDINSSSVNALLNKNVLINNGQDNFSLYCSNNGSVSSIDLSGLNKQLSFIGSYTNLTSINLSGTNRLSVDCGYNNYLTSIDISNSTIYQFNCTACITMNSLNIANTTNYEQNQTSLMANSCGLQTIDFSSSDGWFNIYMAGNQLVNFIPNTTSIKHTLITLGVDENNLNQESVDNAIIMANRMKKRFDNGAYQGGVLFISGGTNASRSSASDDAVAQLLLAGWTITLNS